MRLFRYRETWVVLACGCTLAGLSSLALTLAGAAAAWYYAVCIVLGGIAITQVMRLAPVGAERVRARSRSAPRADA